MQEKYNCHAMPRIGTIYTPFTVETAPMHWKLAEDAFGRIVIENEFAPGLRGIARQKYSHYMLFYGFHESESFNDPYKCKLTMETEEGELGVFVTRSSERPSGLGFCVVKLLRVHKKDCYYPTMLWVKNVEMADGSPLYDIKPYDPIDNVEDAASGRVGSMISSLLKKQSYLSSGPRV